MRQSVTLNIGAPDRAHVRGHHRPEPGRWETFPAKVQIDITSGSGTEGFFVLFVNDADAGRSLIAALEDAVAYLDAHPVEDAA